MQRGQFGASCSALPPLRVEVALDSTYMLMPGQYVCTLFVVFTGRGEGSADRRRLRTAEEVAQSLVSHQRINEVFYNAVDQCLQPNKLI